MSAAVTPAGGQQGWRDGFVTFDDGIELHYRDYPGSADRPPLLCLHGLTRNSRDFAEFADRYSPRFRVIALDFRGRGRSAYDPRPGRYTPLVYARDAIQLLEHLGIGQAVFVGTSLGGLVTMAVAATAPDRIAGAILNDIGPDPSTVGLDRIMSYVGKDIRFKSWDDAAETIADNQGRIPTSFTHENWLAMARRHCREQDGEIAFDYDMAIVEPFKTSGPAPRVDLWPLFGALAQKPLLVVRGELSDLLTAESMAKMREVAPAAKFVVVAGVAHAPMLDEPEAIAAIDDFLGSLAI